MMKTCQLLIAFLGLTFFLACSDDNEPSDPPITYQISLTSSGSSIAEDGGSTTLSVTLDQANEGETMSFSLLTSGDATEGTDYNITGDMSIMNGDRSATMTITAINDSDIEGDENISVELQENLDNVTLTGSSVNITLLDDDFAQAACVGTTDTYSIDLDPTNCTVDIQTSLGINSIYQEEETGGNRVITTNSIPNHNTGMFPNNGNPHTITETDVTYTITASPSVSNEITSLTNTSTGRPRYRFGVLFNGILLAPIAAEFFTNTENQEDNTDWNENALSSQIRLGTDCNNSHVFPSGMYHHHATPSAFIASLNIDGSTPVQIGWAADGFPIYYKYGNKNGAVAELTSSYQLKTEERGGDGVSAPSGCPDGTYTQDYTYAEGLGDLDECNGYQDPELGYIYVITDTYPSISRCFVGSPSNDFRNN